MKKHLFLLIFLFLIIGCTPQLLEKTPEIATPTSITATSSSAPTSTVQIDVTCADLDSAWENGDWEVTLDVLAKLETAVTHCGTTLIAEKQYAAYINYGVTLENNGEIKQAIEQFQAAYQKNLHGPESVAGLNRLQATPLYECVPSELLAPYQPTQTNNDFLEIKNDMFLRNDAPYYMQGVNYYPRFAPWAYFWPESNLTDIEEEFKLISDAGFNTVRLFLHYDFFFTCEPEKAVPNAETFNKLDAIIQLAAQYNLSVLLTLNDLPDLTFRPLYTDTTSNAQTKFIVRRYRDEPTIIAWDLRNEGDIDYGAHPSLEGRFDRKTVLNWLENQANLVKENDPNHLITAGWWGDPSETAVFVDFVSFHHWGTATELAQRIADYKAQISKPILLQEVGYPAQADEGEQYQMSAFLPVLETVKEENLAGWIAWTAFDFAPYGAPFANQEKYFGLWQYDLTPKPFVNSINLTE